MRRNLPVTRREYPFPPGSTLMSTTDPKGRIRYTNEAFVSVSGFTRDELVGKPHNIVRHPDMPPEAFADLWQTMKAGRAWTALIKNRRKDGDYYWVRANSTPVCRDGATVAYMSVRTAPQRSEIEQAEALYAALREGKAGSLRLREGIVVRGGWLAWTSVLRVMPVRWRIRGIALLAALLPAVVAFVAGVSGLPLAALAVALACGALAASVLLEWQIAGPLEKILRQAQTLASGQAVEGLHFDRIDEIGRLQRAVNQSALNLQALADEVTEQIEGIERASREIAQGNAELSSRTEAASSNLVQTAASMDEISGTVGATADNARQASETAGSAARAAETGGEVVSAAVACMAEINESSRRISDIIGVIDGIAFQTNILALNASVEAARAGDQGRGFAVVAAEVRGLAQRSAEAAREIKALISNSSQTIALGSQRVEEAGAAMTEIVREVRRVAELSAEITQATQQQSSGIAQVNEAVVHLDVATQQNAAMVEENAAAAESLSERVARLAETVALFRLSRRDEAADSSARRGVAHTTGGVRHAARGVQPPRTQRTGITAPGADSDAHGAVDAAENEGQAWDGVERRGPRRARNVTRPNFGTGASSGSAGAAGRSAPPAIGREATGTDDWTEF